MSGILGDFEWLPTQQQQRSLTTSISPAYGRAVVVGCLNFGKDFSLVDLGLIWFLAFADELVEFLYIS